MWRVDIEFATDFFATEKWEISLVHVPEADEKEQYSKTLYLDGKQARLIAKRLPLLVKRVDALLPASFESEGEE